MGPKGQRSVVETCPQSSSPAVPLPGMKPKPPQLSQQFSNPEKLAKWYPVSQKNDCPARRWTVLSSWKRLFLRRQRAIITTSSPSSSSSCGRRAVHEYQVVEMLTEFPPPQLPTPWIIYLVTFYAWTVWQCLKTRSCSKSGDITLLLGRPQKFRILLNVKYVPWSLSQTAWRNKTPRGSYWVDPPSHWNDKPLS